MTGQRFDGDLGVQKNTGIEPLSYASVSITPRPPRVIIVIDGGEHWSYWARRALYRADKVWGGAGFAVIPHHDGKVDPALLRGCEAYDPDFVVTYSPTVEDMEHFHPGFFRIRGEDGELLAGADREQMFDMARTEAVPRTADQMAREQIVAVCSSYRSRHPDVGWRENVTSLYDDSSRHFPNVLEMPGAWLGSVFACPAGWGGTLGAAVASHVGVAEPPSRHAAEPELDDDTRNHVASWLLGLPGNAVSKKLAWHPGSPVGVDFRTTPTAHERTTKHLTEISTGISVHRTGLLVVGDSAEDWALARLWRLTFGTAHWLSSVLGLDKDPVPWVLGFGTVRIAHDLHKDAGNLAITSISRSAGDLKIVRDRLIAANPISSPDDQDLAISTIASQALLWQQPATLRLAVKDQWDSPTPVPVTVAVDGTRRMAAPLPAPVLVNSELAGLTDLEWQVDVQWQPGHPVLRRGLDSQELFADRPAFMPTWARSSRYGVTYQSRRYDFVLAGIRQENTLARVALRDLSLGAWIQAKAAEHDLTVRPSEAGLRTAQLARMLGGRQQYVDLFGGPLLPALRAMLATSATTKEAYPDGGGVSLSSTEGVLTFAEICKRTTGLDYDDVRDRVDASLRAGVLRRGMVLLCASCEQKQFQTVDNLGQRWRCVRCDALNDLDRHAWKLPGNEPTWFYDLHPVGRHLLSKNGEVPALLSAYMRAQRKHEREVIDDVEEVMFLQGNDPRVEVDLVAYADDVLTLAECKASDNLTNQEVRKKCRAAAWLRADRVLFATAAVEWKPGTLTRVRDVVDSFAEWGPLGPPEVKFVVGLGREDAGVTDG